jgi:2-phosphoglycerate kinase
MTEVRHHELLPLGEGDLPYSKGLLARALMATGVTAERAYDLALRVERDLSVRGETTVDLGRLEDLAQEVLGDDGGAQVVRRLRRYEELKELDVPVVLLIGGATGTGKSTVATEVAYRLGITRVTSTDVVRQTMRAFFSREFMPSIHTSSFEAATAATSADAEVDPVLSGFLEQTRNVLVGVHAVVERALQEGWSMVIEGVHLVPGMLAPVQGAVVVHCVLAIDDEVDHASHFWVRDAVSDGLRPVQKYLHALDDIRLIQDEIVERAHRAGSAVLVNSEMERAVAAVMELVLESVERHSLVGAHGRDG